MKKTIAIAIAALCAAGAAHAEVVPQGSWVQAWVPASPQFSGFMMQNANPARMGNGDAWTYRDVGADTRQGCNYGYGGYARPDGLNPNWQSYCYKFIWVRLPYARVPTESRGMPVPLVDVKKWSWGGPATDEVVIAQTQGTEDDPDDSRNVPDANGKGAFRIICRSGQMLFDDPLVYPNQPGRAHLHSFFGNAGVNASTVTREQIVASRRSTCTGGGLNASAYWAPTWIDTETGEPLRYSHAQIYYKNGYHVTDPTSIQAVPKGLRMLAGSMMRTDDSGQHDYTCSRGSGGVWTKRVPQCEIGDTLIFRQIFPVCWDGVNLDHAGDHRSHMAYASSARGNVNGCPATHPVRIQELTYLLYREVDRPVSRMRLSSDMPSQFAGQSAHADYMEGWLREADIRQDHIPDAQQSSIEEIARSCNQADADCHSHIVAPHKVIRNTDLYLPPQ